MIYTRSLKSMVTQENYKRWMQIILVSIVAAKILLMGFFSSDYQDKMFMPFVENFLAGNNPYEFYYQNGLIASFPYFPLMLLLDTIGGLGIKILAISNVFVQNIIFKIPLFIFDCILVNDVRLKIPK